jgi:4-amino-4-deoxy-L-arabinose transferase-like glycosyltransferase
VRPGAKKERYKRRKPILTLRGHSPKPAPLSPDVLRTSYFVLLIALALATLLLVYARPLTATIPVGAAGDRAGVLDFFDREHNPAGVPYRWTRDRSTLIFHAAGLAFPANRTATLELHLVSSRPAGVAAPRVTVTRAGQLGGTQTIAGESRARFAVGTVGGGPVDARITIQSDTFTPAGDKRELGVALLGPARLAQDGGGLALPPFGAWCYWFATLLCAYGVVLALLRRPNRAALATGGVLVIGTVIALIDRVRFWQYMHLALLLLLALLPILWRRDIAAWAARWLAWAQKRLGLSAPTLVALGLLPAASAQILLTANRLPALALPLYVLGLMLILPGIRPPPPPHAGGSRFTSARRFAASPGVEMSYSPQHGGAGGAVELLLLAGILLLAAAARFYRLGEIPFSLWRDEARHGLEALHILRDPSYRPVYVPAISLPGLFPALLALVFKVFGAGIASLRGLTAGAGVVAVGLLWAVARRLWGPRVALVAALLAAVGSWRVSIDRLAFDTAPTTVCTLGAFLAFLWGVDEVRAGRRGLLAFALAGLGGGLAIYNYYPGRFALPVLAGATVVLLLLWGWRAGRRVLAGLALALAVAVVTLTPLARYAIEQPDNFFKRTEQVYLLADSSLQGRTAVEAVERNLLTHAVMFNWHGEPNARHHMPKWPMLDAVTGLCFVVGLALAVIAAIGGQFPAFFTLGWLLALLGPSIVSIDAPSAVRAQDAAPAAYLLAALGFVALWERLAALDAPALLRRAAPAIATLALTLTVGINLWIYFVRMPGDPRVISKFQYAGETRAGLLIATTHARAPNLATYVPQPFTGDEVLIFMANGAPVASLPDNPAALPPGPVLIVVPRAEGQDFAQQTAAARRLAAAAGLHEIPGDRPPGGGGPVFVAFARDLP